MFRTNAALSGTNSAQDAPSRGATNGTAVRLSEGSMRKSYRIVMSTLFLGFTSLAFAQANSIIYNLRIRIGEAPAVDHQYVIPFGKSLRVPAAGSLSYQMDVTPAD